MASAGGIEYHVRALFQIDAAGKQSQALTAFADALVSTGSKIQSIGRSIMGNSAQIAMSVMKTSALLGTGLIVGGLLGGLYKAIELNVELENATFGVASSLQLMARNGGDFSKNMEEAAWIMGELEKRAAASPASFEQAQELFKNMLPGAIMVTDNMDRILDMAEAALTLGIQMGGDFTQAGADLRRIMTGQAGADVRVWTEGFSKAISDVAEAGGGKAGKALGGKFGEDLTKAFNKLSPEDRFALVEKAVNRLGPATAAAATGWAGLTSTVQTLGVWLLRVAGGQSFDRIKKRLEAWTKEGGLFGKDGKNKMEKFARAVGVGFGNMIDRALDGFERVFNYVSNNWEDILDQFHKIVRGIKTAAKLAVVAGAGRTVAGAGVAGAGGVMAGVGGLIKGAPELMRIVAAVGGLGVAAAIALPLVLLLSVVMFGLGIIAAGGLAYFIEKFDEFKTAIAEGSVQLEPLYEAIGLLWWRMTEMGAAIFGLHDPVDGANTAVSALVGGLDAMTGAMAFTLRALGVMKFAWDVITLGVRGVYLGVVGIVQALLWAIWTAVDAIPGATAAADAVGDAYRNVSEHTSSVVAGMRETAGDDRLFQAANALENYKAGLGEGVKTKVEGMFGAPGAGMGSKDGEGEKPKRPTGGNTYINKVVVQQDLRGERPDRVIGHFNKALKQASQRRGSAFTQQPGS